MVKKTGMRRTKTIRDTIQEGKKYLDNEKQIEKTKKSTIQKRIKKDTKTKK